MVNIRRVMDCKFKYMRRIFVVLSVFAMAFGIMSCSSNDSASMGGATPREAAEDYYINLISGNYEAICVSSYTYVMAIDEVKKEFDKEMDSDIKQMKRFVDKIGGIKDYNVESVEENDNKAVVKTKIFMGNGNTEVDVLDLRKYEGRWYVFY